MKLVPMSTSLGFEDMPTVVGPPVPTLKDAPKDSRSVFVSMGLFKKGLMPSEPLTTQHVEWLSQTTTGIDVCRADYLNAQQSVDDIAELGVSLTEDELSAMAEKVDEGPPQGMLQMPQGSFVLGNLNVVKGSSLADVAAWGQGDPHDVVGAYASLTTHRWLRSPDPELNLPAPGPCYGVYCLDKPASSELREAIELAQVHADSLPLVRGAIEVASARLAIEEEAHRREAEARCEEEIEDRLKLRRREVELLGQA